MAQHITVKEYDPAWRELYEKEKALIADILQENLVAVYHIGSTSVPALAAKPVIDIMVVVKSLDAADGAAEKFAEAGYEYLGEFGIAGRRYLRKGGDERTHQIHIFRADDTHNLGGILPSATICARTKTRARNMPNSKRRSRKNSLTT